MSPWHALLLVVAAGLVVYSLRRETVDSRSLTSVLARAAFLAVAAGSLILDPAAISAWPVGVIASGLVGGAGLGVLHLRSRSDRPAYGGGIHALTGLATVLLAFWLEYEMDSAYDAMRSVSGALALELAAGGTALAVYSFALKVMHRQDQGAMGMAGRSRILSMVGAGVMLLMAAGAGVLLAVSPMVSYEWLHALELGFLAGLPLMVGGALFSAGGVVLLGLSVGIRSEPRWSVCLLALAVVLLGLLTETVVALVPAGLAMGMALPGCLNRRIRSDLTGVNQPDRA